MGGFHQMDNLKAGEEILISKNSWSWEIYELEQWKVCKPS
jgi:hypothetical protein